jgi:hypothetical protein
LLNIPNKVKIVPNLSISFVQVYVEDRKNFEVKVIFKNFFTESEKKLRLAKKFFAESQPVDSW